MIRDIRKSDHNLWEWSKNKCVCGYLEHRYGIEGLAVCLSYHRGFWQNAKNPGRVTSRMGFDCILVTTNSRSIIDHRLVKISNSQNTTRNMVTMMPGDPP